MSYSDNLDIRNQPVDEGIRISRRENIVATSMTSRRPALRRIQDRPYGIVHRQEKTPSCKRAAFGVPVPCVLGIHDGLRMPSRLTQSHGRDVP